MTKRRFTDCDMWEGEWFMGLSTEMKVMWRYLCDRCDNAGVWIVNQKLAEFQLGFRFDPALALKALEVEVESFAGGSKWRLKQFIAFQYPNGLTEKSAPHRQVLRLLESHGLTKDGAQKATDRLSDQAKATDSLPHPSTLQDDGSRLPGSLKDKDTDQTRTRTRQGESEGGADIFDPAASPGSAADLAAEDRWPYVQRFPWVTKIAAVVGTALHRRNWPAWERLIDAQHWTIEQVLAAADEIPARERWPDRVEEILADQPRRSAAAKQAATPKPRSLPDQAKAIVAHDGLVACLSRLDLTDGQRAQIKTAEDLGYLFEENEYWAKQLVERSAKQGAA